MTEIRCKKCKRLLMKVKKDLVGNEYHSIPENAIAKEKGWEIKCPKCGYINNI